MPCRLIRSSHYLVSFKKHRDRLKPSEINSLRLSTVVIMLSTEQTVQNSWGCYQTLVVANLLTIYAALVFHINTIMGAHIAVSAKKSFMLMEVVQHITLLQMMMMQR